VELAAEVDGSHATGAELAEERDAAEERTGMGVAGERRKERVGREVGGRKSHGESIGEGSEDRRVAEKIVPMSVPDLNPRPARRASAAAAA
jgi:hypothetical protein